MTGFESRFQYSHAQNGFASRFQYLPPLDERFEPPTFNLNSQGFCPSSDASEGTSYTSESRSSVYTLGNTLKDEERQDTANNETLASEAAKVVRQQGIVITDLIGSGVASQVFLATGPPGWVAVKAIASGTCSASDRDLLSKIKHPNICQIFGVMEGPPLCYVLEYCLGGDLFKALHSRKKGTDKLIPLGRQCQLSVACDVASAIAYMHSEDMIHRDIKSPNVLLTQPIVDTGCNPPAKLADFGLAKVSQQYNTAGVGTTRWMAPDLARETYGSSADVFSFGILLWEILSRKIPFANHKSDHTLFLKVCLEDLRPNVSECAFISSEIVKLMPKCWAKDASSRPSMNEVHTILRGVLDKSGDFSNLWLGHDSDSGDDLQVGVGADSEAESDNLEFSKADSGQVRRGSKGSFGNASTTLSEQDSQEPEELHTSGEVITQGAHLEISKADVVSQRQELQGSWTSGGVSQRGAEVEKVESLHHSDKTQDRHYVAPQLQDLPKSCISGGESHRSGVTCACFQGLLLFLNRSDS